MVEDETLAAPARRANLPGSCPRHLPVRPGCYHAAYRSTGYANGPPGEGACRGDLSPQVPAAVPSAVPTVVSTTTTLPATGHRAQRHRDANWNGLRTSARG